jgi:hypothetical protein
MVAGLSLHPISRIPTIQHQIRSIRGRPSRIWWTGTSRGKFVRFEVDRAGFDGEERAEDVRRGEGWLSGSTWNWKLSAWRGGAGGVPAAAPSHAAGDAALRQSAAAAVRPLSAGNKCLYFRISVVGELYCWYSWCVLQDGMLTVL